MKVAAINGLRVYSQNRSKANNSTASYMSHSDVAMKDTVSFGNIEETSLQRATKTFKNALKVAKQIFISLNDDPNVSRSIDEESMTFRKTVASAMERIKQEILPLKDDLDLFRCSGRFDTLGDAGIYVSNDKINGFYVEQCTDGGILLKGLEIKPNENTVRITVETQAKKPLIKTALCRIDEPGVFETKVIRYKDVRRRRNEILESKTVGHI